jgi:hypothetical protein
LNAFSAEIEYPAWESCIKNSPFETAVSGIFEYPQFYSTPRHLQIAIIPSTEQGIICVDDIHYDARYCGEILPPPPTVVPPPNASLSTGSPLRIVTDWSAVELPPLPTTPLSQRKTTKDSEPFIPLIPPPPPLVVNPFVVSPILPTFPPISKSIFTLPPLLGNTSPPHHSKKTKSHVTKLTPLTPITRPTTTEESEVEEESAAEENGEMESKSESGSEEAITTTERSTTTETRRTTTKKFCFKHNFGILKKIAG